MKTRFLFFVLLAVCIPAFAQTNKKAANAIKEVLKEDFDPFVREADKKAPGSTSTVQSPGQYPSGNNWNSSSSTPSQSSSSSQTPCSICGGSGRCSGTYSYSSTAQSLYCNGSGICSQCGGKKIINNLYTGNAMTCSYCNGSGRCSRCNGTGRCSSCGGTGHK